MHANTGLNNILTCVKLQYLGPEINTEALNHCKIITNLFFLLLFLVLFVATSRLLLPAPSLYKFSTNTPPFFKFISSFGLNLCLMSNVFFSDYPWRFPNSTTDSNVIKWLYIPDFRTRPDPWFLLCAFLKLVFTDVMLVHEES